MLTACMRACMADAVMIWRIDRWVVPAAPAGWTKSAEPIVNSRPRPGEARSSGICLSGVIGSDDATRPPPGLPTSNGAVTVCV